MVFFFKKIDTDVRVTFLPNVNGEKGKDNYLNKVVLAALQELPSEKATEYVHSLLKDDAAAKSLQTDKKINIPVSNKLCDLLIIYSVCCTFNYGCLISILHAE